jgi:predicted Zn-dependent peptidase
MVVAAAGRVDPERFQAQVARLFADLPSTPKGTPADARYGGGVFTEVDELEQVHLIVGFPGIGARHPDVYAHAVYSTLLGGGMSSRLFQEVREKRGLAYAVYSFGSSYLDGGLFGVYAGTGVDELPALVPVLAEQLVDVAVSVSPRELARAKAQLRASLLMSRESTSARVETLAQHQLIWGRPLPTAELLAILDAVTADDVRRVAGQVASGPPTVATLGPPGTIDVHEALVARLPGRPH